MSETPSELKYAPTHEWAKPIGDDVIEVGISDYAQESLGDVVYVELPQVGANVTAAQECAAVESVKAASDIYAPVGGEVTEVNEELEDNPELINQSPYGEGWMFRIRCIDAAQLNNLLSDQGYIESLDDQ